MTYNALLCLYQFLYYKAKAHFFRKHFVCIHSFLFLFFYFGCCYWTLGLSWNLLRFIRGWCLHFIVGFLLFFFWYFKIFHFVNYFSFLIALLLFFFFFLFCFLLVLRSIIISLPPPLYNKSFWIFLKLRKYILIFIQSTNFSCKFSFKRMRVNIND